MTTVKALELLPEDTICLRGQQTEIVSIEGVQGRLRILCKDKAQVFCVPDQPIELVSTGHVNQF